MAIGAKRPCKQPGCPHLVTSGFCAQHHHKVQQYERERGTGAQRGYGARHQRWRRDILGRDPLCLACLARRRYAPSTVADHIVPLSRDGTWELENGQGLCRRCHGRKTGMETRGLVVLVVPNRGLMGEMPPRVSKTSTVSRLDQSLGSAHTPRIKLFGESP